MIAHAQTLFDVLHVVSVLANTLLPLAMTLALVFFFWGLAKFILSANSEEGRKRGRSTMLWGIVTLFVLSAIWGIILFFSGVLGTPVGGECNPTQILPNGTSACL